LDHLDLVAGIVDALGMGEGPMVLQQNPRHRLMVPWIDATPLNHETRGRALDTLYAVG
jgi:hypothetical protein